MPLSYQQVGAVRRAAWPLAPVDRNAFVAAVAEQLRHVVDPGDGEVHRAIRQVQARFRVSSLDQARGAYR
jgi:hypothetical protein